MATGHLEKRSEHGWVIIVDYGRQKDPETGKIKQVRKQRSLKNCTKSQALVKLHNTLSDLNKGQPFEPSQESLGAYLRRWYRESCVPRLQPSTLECYRIAIEKHLIPELGLIPLSQLRPPALQTAYMKMLDKGTHKRSIEMSHIVLKIALKQALKNDLILRNPTDAVMPPRPDKRQITALSPDEVSRLIAGATGEGILELMILAFHTGARRGELLALKWSDIDFEEGTIRIDKTLQRIDKHVIVKSPKTKRGCRTIPVDVGALSLLRSMFERSTSSLVFSRINGSPLDPSTVTHQFKRIARKTGFPSMRFHDMRHTYATTALLAHVDLRIVQDLLGHEDISTTANIYTHVVGDMKKQAAEAIGRLLNNGKQQISSRSETEDDKGK